MKKKNKKSAVSVEDFFSRAQKLKNITFPTSTPKLVIVKCNEEALGFRFICYSHELLGNSIDKAIFDHTVRECHRICEQSWGNRRHDEEDDHTEGHKRILKFTVCLMFLAFILLIGCVYGDKSPELLKASLILLGIAVAVTLVLVLKSAFESHEFFDFEPTCYSRIWEYLQKENTDIYASKGLEWRVHPKFYWLELHVHNYKENEPEIVVTDQLRRKSFKIDVNRKLS